MPLSCSSALTRASGMPESSASASSNMSTLPESSARSTRPAVSWPLSRRCRMSGRISLSQRDRGERDGRLLAGLLGDALGVVLLQPFARRDEAGERLGELGDQRLPGRRRQIVARQHGFADGGEMAEAGDDAVERERRDLGLHVLDQHQTGLGRADLGDGGGDGARQRGAVGDRGLRLRAAGRDRIDQIGVDQERRMLEHPARHLRLVGGERRGSPAAASVR